MRGTAELLDEKKRRHSRNPVQARRRAAAAYRKSEKARRDQQPLIVAGERFDAASVQAFDGFGQQWDRERERDCSSIESATKIDLHPSHSDSTVPTIGAIAGAPETTELSNASFEAA